ncbi:MAG: hypothetical protein IJP02_03000 [Oscillospiraceae bacterium]|nr:hypothetical protein [Oscillospiraceae bacterium]
MKKLAIWPLALLTSLVSLAGMCLFDLVLSLFYYVIGLVPFLTDILDYLGDILDLGLTALFAGFVATEIWVFGHTLIEKINGASIPYSKGPVFRINHVFFFLAAAALLFVGWQFFSLVGSVVTGYTTGYEGFGRLLLFFKAIKDAFAFVCAEHLVIYRIGSASLILSVVHLFSEHFIKD